VRAAVPIVTARAPMRISLAGGGTDLPSFAGRFGSTVVSLAIDCRVTVAACAPAGYEQARRRLSGVELMTHDDLMRGDFAPAVLARAGKTNVRLACCSDAPARSGLGGSGAFSVAMTLALRPDWLNDPIALAEQASAIELDDLRRPVGKQDHYMAVLGGLQALRIGRDGTVVAESLPLTDRLRSYVAGSLRLFHTGVQRDAGDVLTVQDQRTRRDDRATLRGLHAIRELADALLAALAADRVQQIGPIIGEHWRHKLGLSDTVAIPRGVELHDRAIGAGADGAKLLGAGGGGFLLVACRPERQAELCAAMAAADARELPFGVAERGATAHLGVLAPECAPLEMAGRPQQ
jgi:D-glycero-alpha-D-manno-heptose-7-phosphate kinase